jgi:hypothetical protein
MKINKEKHTKTCEKSFDLWFISDQINYLFILLGGEVALGGADYLFNFTLFNGVSQNMIQWKQAKYLLKFGLLNFSTPTPLDLLIDWL